jgi:uncharacterized protein YacL
VELVRLIVVALLAAAGWEVASRIGSFDSLRLFLGVVVGAGVGYVLGGMLGRTTATAASEVEQEFRRVPAADILAGAIGLIAGFVPAALLTVPLFHLPLTAALPAVAFLYFVAGSVGWRVGRAKSDELFAMFGVKARAAGTRAGDVLVLDSSAILDGRIGSLVRLGFLTGSLLVTTGVLEELQRVADASDPVRRGRGRRALDLLLELRRDPFVDVSLVDEDGRERAEEVDIRLVRLARARGGTLVTNDANLAKVAAALDVPVRSINALAEALRPSILIGDRVQVRLQRRGRDAGQAVGFLDDGTMIVVEEAADLVGGTHWVDVTNVLQSQNGRMAFARPAVDPGPAERP